MKQDTTKPATKQDLEKLEERLEERFEKKFATKQDLIYLEEKLEKRFEKKFATKDDLKKNISALEIRTDIKMENMERRIDENARKYRDEVLTAMDHIAGQLKTMIEDQEIANEHARIMLERIENHETRITKLETHSKQN